MSQVALHIFLQEDWTVLHSNQARDTLSMEQESMHVTHSSSFTLVPYQAQANIGSSSRGVVLGA